MNNKKQKQKKNRFGFRVVWGQYYSYPVFLV